MADLAEGFLRDWLSNNRKDLNTRFQIAKRRFPNIDSQMCLDLFGEILPPLAEKGEANTETLLFTLYDLILLHIGRNTLGREKNTSGVSILLRKVFPEIRPILLKEPRYLLGALSNAVERMETQGEAFARGISRLVPFVETPEQLLDAGALFAWRLGEARLRKQVLQKAKNLSERAVLEALMLSSWPEGCKSFLLSMLEVDSWHTPEQLISQKTLKALTDTPAKQKVNPISFKRNKIPFPNTWNSHNLLGNFSGFGGHFQTPPILLDAKDLANKNRIWVKSGERIFRIDADAFGWVCRPDPSVDFPIQKTKPTPTKKTNYITKLFGNFLEGFQKENSKTGQAIEKILSQSTSCLVFSDALFVTIHDSFRIRVFVPPVQQI